MLELKGYQRDALHALDSFFSSYDRLRLPGPAFDASAKPDPSGVTVPYRPLRQPESLATVPYVCVRIPTGGGKTLVACHAAGNVAKALHADFPTILWLVPSTTILEQTRRALNDPRHPYARALRSVLGPYELLDLEAALYAGRAKYEGGAVVLVATVQSFRIDRALLDRAYSGQADEARGEERVIRRVYSDDGYLMDHFTGLTPAQTADLEMLEGVPRKTLENVLRLRRPIVFVDEGHNMHAPLSIETLARFRPSAIVEFTATPNLNPGAPSNVLVSVAAGELKAASMIKLPIRLAVRQNWKTLLSDAVACRAQLEQLAAIERQLTGEDIRPVMLLQAQPRRGDSPITVDVLLETLQNDHKIAREEIAIATGDADELERFTGKPDCPVRYILTVNKLREGWDCPAAYVLYSVAASRSETAVEQILGRVMRLPGATEKKTPALNEAHAFVASATFQDAASNLCDGLIHHGFNPFDAKNAIKSTTPLPDPDTNSLQFVYTVEVPPEVTPSMVPATLRLKVDVLPDQNALTCRGTLQEPERDLLRAAMTSPQARAAIDLLYRRSHNLADEDFGTPSERGERFRIPVLAVKYGDLFEVFDDVDAHLTLDDKNALLTETEYKPGGGAGWLGTLDLNERQRLELVDSPEALDDVQSTMRSWASDTHWSRVELAGWINGKFSHPDIPFDEMNRFLNRALACLEADRGIPLSRLVHDKYRLMAALEQKVREYRLSAQDSAYQGMLFASSSPVVVDPSVCFTFEPGRYAYTRLYPDDKPRFKKHFYPEVAALDTTEEEKCAWEIDNSPHIETWVRNPPSGDRAFRFKTPKGWFYPDFVARLKDGRFIVVEYKGAHLVPLAAEDEALGQCYEERSHGHCLFVMVKDKGWDALHAKLVTARPSSDE